MNSKFAGGRCAIVTVLVFAGSVRADIFDGFESYSVGGQPGGIWEDASAYITNPTSNDPTMSVISTTDAFGNATQAVQISADNIGTSGGIMGRVGHHSIQRFETDLRLDQAGNGSSPNWISAAGFVQVTDQSDFNWMPQAFVYANGNSNRFRLYVRNADGQSGASRDFGLGTESWSYNTWYRVVLEVDTTTGVFSTLITDIESGQIISDVSRTYAGWNEDFGQYDVISINDGEYGSNPGTVGNSATIDNLGYIPSPGSFIVLLSGGAMLGKRRR